MDRPQLLEYPEKPKAPKYHNTPLAKVPAQEIDNATKDTKEYLALLDEFEKKRREVQIENRRLENEYEQKCWDEIYDENGVGTDERENELVKWVAREAWNKGHSCGMSEVKIYFSDFIEAYEIHKRLLQQALSELHNAKANAK